MCYISEGKGYFQVLVGAKTLRGAKLLATRVLKRGEAEKVEIAVQCRPTTTYQRAHCHSMQAVAARARGKRWVKTDRTF